MILLKWAALCCTVALLTLILTPYMKSQTSSSAVNSPCHIKRNSNGRIADRHCTPGSVFPGTTASEICIVGWAAAHRNVSYRLKELVYRRYGITHRNPYGQPGSYEIDHLIPLELGGSNSLANLWPEPFPGYESKDFTENTLRALVCEGGNRENRLKAAQSLIVKLFSR